MHVLSAVLAAWQVAISAIASDLLGLHQSGSESESTAIHSIFRCGNFGMLVVSGRNKLVDVAGTLRSMAATTAARGGQAGGIVSLLADGSSVRSRHVPTKRGDVAVELVRRFWLLLWRVGFGIGLKDISRGARKTRTLDGEGDPEVSGPHYNTS